MDKELFIKLINKTPETGRNVISFDDDSIPNFDNDKLNKLNKKFIIETHNNLIKSGYGSLLAGSYGNQNLFSYKDTVNFEKIPDLNMHTFYDIHIFKKAENASWNKNNESDQIPSVEIIKTNIKY